MWIGLLSRHILENSVVIRYCDCSCRHDNDVPWQQLTDVPCW